MKKRLYTLTCLAVLFSNISRGGELPLFSSLRAEIENQIAIVSSNNSAPNKKLVARLRSSLSLVNRTQPTLIKGSSALATLAKSLGRTSISNAFIPALIETRGMYIDAMETRLSVLQDRLAHTMPGNTQTAAQTALDRVGAALGDAGTNNNFAVSLSSLSKTAKALLKAEKSVAKAETAPPGANFLTATITESNQGVALYKPTGKDNLGADYGPLSGKIFIHGYDSTELGGGREQLRFLTLFVIVPGEGTHTLSLPNAGDGSYASYSRLTLDESGTVESDIDYSVGFYSSGTGTVIITVNLKAKVVWGEFTFTAKNSKNPDLEATVTGSFLLRLEESDDGNVR